MGMGKGSGPKGKLQEEEKKKGRHGQGQQDLLGGLCRDPGQILREENCFYSVSEWGGRNGERGPEREKCTRTCSCLRTKLENIVDVFTSKILKDREWSRCSRNSGEELMNTVRSLTKS